jgi:integrase
MNGKPLTTPAKWIIDKRDQHGRVVDLHALRHTFGMRLVANGVDIKTTQSLMRHSTASLTLSVYVHKDSQRMEVAVAALPVIESNRNIAGAWSG